MSIITQLRIKLKILRILSKNNYKLTAIVSDTHDIDAGGKTKRGRLLYMGAEKYIYDR